MEKDKGRNCISDSPSSADSTMFARSSLSALRAATKPTLGRRAIHIENTVGNVNHSPAPRPPPRDSYTRPASLRTVPTAPAPLQRLRTED